MSNPDILYDGWSLVYQPDSPPALHLQALLSFHPHQVQARVALPGELAFALPDGVEVYLHPSGATERDRLVWEQRSLPQMARRLGAGLLHLIALNSPLFGGAPAVISPAGFGSGTSPRETGQAYGLAARLRQAAGQGGLSRLKTVFWPADLPAGKAGAAAAGGAPGILARGFQCRAASPISQSAIRAFFYSRWQRSPQ